MLIDELLTARMKIIINPTDENTSRAVHLEAAIAARTKAASTDISPLIAQLRDVLKECWDAQEIVFTSDNVYTVYHAAKVAQQTNALRNTIIRQIDTLLGEHHITPLEKTYV